MRKGPDVQRVTIRRASILAACLAILYIGYITISLALIPSPGALRNRRMNMTIQVRDWHGHYHPFVVGPRNHYWVPARSIPPEMKWAVILAEDANFYSHEGIDVKAIKNAVEYDLEKRRMARGASTITQQVAKNLFLTRKKTITRKLMEIYLAVRMERELTKGRIVELYLNVVELGPMVYGIGHGARYYFGKPAAELTPRECSFLAAMLPGPRVAYNPYKRLERVLRRSDMILGLMRKRGVLTDAEYRLAMAETPNIAGLQKKVDKSLEAPVVFTPLSSTGRALPEQAPNDSGKERKGEVQESAHEAPSKGEVPRTPATAPGEAKP